MRPDRDQWALGLAVLTAERTTCIRRKVGCVLLNARGHVLATGNNGVAAGQPHCNEVTDKKLNPTHLLRWKRTWIEVDGEPATLDRPIMRKGHENDTVPVYGHACKGHDLPPGKDSCEAIHAEQNALLQCRDVYQIHTCYVTLSPCLACAKLLLNTSCEKIVFIDEFEKPEAKDLWERAGRLWVRGEPPVI